MLFIMKMCPNLAVIEIGSTHLKNFGMNVVLRNSFLCPLGIMKVT